MNESNATSFFDAQDDPFFSTKLSSLHTFSVVAEYKSFRAAAQNMFVSPQALNKQIAVLEERIGLPLLQRSPRGFTLTPYGEQVTQYTASMVHNMKQLRRDLTAMYVENNHILRLAYSNNLYDTALHMYMMDFHDEDTNCQMKSKRLSYDKVMEIANGNEPYVIITSRPPTVNNKFNITVLHDAQYHILTHRDNPLAKLRDIDVSDLGDTTLILCAELFRANQYLLKYCSEHKTSVNSRLETAGFQAGIDLCRQNKGALLMADYVDENLDTSDLVRVSPKSGLFSLELVMLVRKDIDYSTMEHKFIKYMQAYTP